MSNRPEHVLPPELTKISERAIELLAIPEDETHTLLDIGCGSGLSGDCISESGHNWVGVDISQHMLSVAKDRECEGDLINLDMGCGLPFRGASFDGAISISAIQWLCNAETSQHNPIRRIRNFFSSLYACLTRDARAVLQFYPESVQQMELLQNEALRAGFNGGVIVDFPNSTKAKKCFLVLNVNPVRKMPEAIDSHAQGVIPMGKSVQSAREARRAGKHPKHSVAWIKHKKERAAMKVMETAQTSKYTGRKRKPKF